MSDGRALVFPQAIALTGRAIDVPGKGIMFCASAFLPFQLSDGAPIKPPDWYETLSSYGGDNAIPDMMTPLPGAEVLVFGNLPPVGEEPRKASLRCGSISRRFTLYQDIECPDAPIVADTSAAVWHKEDNPEGRGGPEDDRKPLIIDDDTPEEPLWLGPTPYDHPVRMRQIGVPDEQSGTGWPKDANPSLLYESHSAFWARDGLQPGELLEFDGLSEENRSLHIPRYRIAITSGRSDGRWILESARIHCVMLLPSENMGSVIWRAAFPLGEDILGESVSALVAALEDADAPMKEDAAERWARVAIDRWVDPVQAVNDRPLLPPKLAAAVVLPFAIGDDLIEKRHAAAEEWLREEYDVPDENPFQSAIPEEMDQIDQALDKVNDDSSDEQPPDTEAVGDIASNVLALSKRRHEQAGFEEPSEEEEREPVIRGSKLAAEIKTRLSKPYSAENEVNIATQIDELDSDSIDSGNILEKLAKGRIISLKPSFFWPALPEDEAIQFGDKIIERLSEEDLGRHIDISTAWIVGETKEDGSRERVISNRRIDGLLAEETQWRGIEFSNCEFIDSSFLGGRFEDCEFSGCTFNKTNLSEVTLVNSKLKDCNLLDLSITTPIWMDCEFKDCNLERVTMMDGGMSDLKFSGGRWQEVQCTEGLLVRLAFHKTDMREVLFMSTHLPNSEFKQLSMFKVWGMNMGLPGSVFEEVDATTCGFIGSFHFDEARFIRTRFVEVGFSNAIFKDAVFTPGCQFSSCDLGGAVFENTELTGVRFLQCSMPTSVWSNTKANDAWFFGSVVRGVDFNDTELARAVFADADISGAKFQPDKTIGTDFRGTINTDS